MGWQSEFEQTVFPAIVNALPCRLSVIHNVYWIYIHVRTTPIYLSLSLPLSPSLPPSLSPSHPSSLTPTKAPEFASGHVPGALNFPLGEAGGTIVGPEDGNFAIWVGTLVPSSAELLLVNPPGKDGEALQRLSRIGYSKVPVPVPMG